MTTINARLLSARLAAGISQTTLAEAAGVHRSTIQRLERGDEGVALQHVRAIARVLGLTLSLLQPEVGQ